MENEIEITPSALLDLAYCERRFYLKTIEKQNNINDRMMDGLIAHKTVDKYKIEKRGNLTKVFSLNIYNQKYSIYGIADLVEFYNDFDGVFVNFLNGNFNIIPIEYKVGKKKIIEAEQIQLTSQVICLEEMYNCKINNGIIYYVKSKDRVEIEINDRLRDKTIMLIDKAKDIIKQKKYVQPKYLKRCNNCSMYDICNPKNILIKQYMEKIRKI